LRLKEHRSGPTAQGCSRFQAVEHFKVGNNLQLTLERRAMEDRGGNIKSGDTHHEGIERAYTERQI